MVCPDCVLILLGADHVGLLSGYVLKSCTTSWCQLENALILMRVKVGIIHLGRGLAGSMQIIIPWLSRSKFGVAFRGQRIENFEITTPSSVKS